MTNRADRAYLDRPITDVDAARAAAAMAAAHWGLGDPELFRMGMNAIFLTDHHALRVGTPNFDAGSALELAGFLDRTGLRVPRPARDESVAVGDLTITCWERVRSTGEPLEWGAIGAMVRTLHSIEPSLLPASVPLPTPDVLPWWDFESMLTRVDATLDSDARRGLEAAIERNRGWEKPTGSVVCHGDVHPGNVVMTSGGAVLLDWDLLCWAPPGWDHAPMLTWEQRWGGEHGAYEAFAAGYGASLVRDPAAMAYAELRLVAATLLRLVAATTDPTAGPEVERRLLYWRGERAAPMWTAQ